MKTKAYFNGITNSIKKELENAQHTIYVAVAWLTDQTLISVLEQKQKEGLAVCVITSRHENNDVYKLESLHKAGGEVYLVGANDVRSRGFMHNKFCMIDYQKVITGSFNWSYNAGTSEENIVIIEEKQLAIDYANHFHKLIKGEGDFAFDSESNEIKIFFFTNNNRIKKNEKVKLEWKVENANTIEISTIGDNLSDEGTKNISPECDTIFSLTAQRGDISKHKNIHIQVVPPPSIHFNIDKSHIIQGMEETQIHWKVENALGVTIDNNIGEVAHEGSKFVMPDKSTVYNIIAMGEFEKAEHRVRLNVIQTPKIEIIKIPIPTKISTEATLTFQSNTIKGVSLDKSMFQYRTPKIDFLEFKTIHAPQIKEISDVYGKEISDLEIPKGILIGDEDGGKAFTDNSILSVFKDKILRVLKDRYKENWRMSFIIDLLRKKTHKP